MPLMSSRFALLVALALLMLAGCAQLPTTKISQIPDKPIFGRSQGASKGIQFPPVGEKRLEITIKDGKLTGNLVNAPAGEVLSLIQQQLPVQFVHRSKLYARITARLKEVPFEEAFELLMKAGGYKAEKSGEVYLITQAPPEEGSSPAKTLAVQEVYLQYVDATSVLEHLRAAYQNITDPQYGFGLLPGNSGIYVIGPPAQLQEVLDIIARMDRELPQVLIEAMVIEMKRTDFQEVSQTLSEFPAHLLSEIPEELTGRFDPGSLEAPALRFRFRVTDRSRDRFFLEIFALVQKERARIVSRPYIASRSGEAAEIRAEQIQNIRSESLQSGERLSSLEELRAGTTMLITPTVNPDRTISMRMELGQSEFIAGAEAESTRTSNSAKFRVNVHDGETIVTGGLIKRRRIRNQAYIPFLGRIPVLKYIFGSFVSNVEESEIVFILTPHILPIDYEEFRDRKLPFQGEPP
ncbi:MAG: hypothetical protein HYY96_17010 [Candidatus Tectomicrobia bacterium]|nr:hypothetical protein [Candidatus Tectomicrobia bacterium]